MARAESRCKCSSPRICFGPAAIGLTGADANLVRLYGDQPLDRLHLSIHKQHVWNLNRLFVCAPGRECKVARAPPQDNVMEQILTTLLKDKRVRVETAGPTAHQALLDHLPRAHSPHGQPIKSKDGSQTISNAVENIR